MFLGIFDSIFCFKICFQPPKKKKSYFLKSRNDSRINYVDPLVIPYFERICFIVQLKGYFIKIHWKFQEKLSRERV